MSIEFRQPTLQEAAESILRLVLQDSRSRELAFYKEKYGEVFASQVEALVKKKWKKR